MLRKYGINGELLKLCLSMGVVYYLVHTESTFLGLETGKLFVLGMANFLY